MAISLQSHLITQAIHHQSLLCLGKTNLWRDTSKAHTAGRTCASAALSARDDDEISLCLSYTGGDSAHTALSYELHAYRCCRVDILEIKDELGKVFDGIDVMMRWRRDESDARNSVTSLGNDFIDLESRQLSALTRLSTLSYFDLKFLGIDKVFRCDAEASGCYLLGLTAEAYAIHRGMIALIVLAAFTGVASCAEFVHGKSKSFVCLNAESAE